MNRKRISVEQIIAVLKQAEGWYQGNTPAPWGRIQRMSNHNFSKRGALCQNCAKTLSILTVGESFGRRFCLVVLRGAAESGVGFYEINPPANSKRP